MRRLTAWMLLASVYFSFLTPFAIRGQDIAMMRETKTKDVPPGLQFRLSEGTEGAESREKQSLSPSDPLSRREASSLLSRLPSIKSEVSDETDFAKRAGTLPAPKTGKQIPVK